MKPIISNHAASCGRVQAGVAIDELACELQRPLRPLWISQNSTIWLNEVAPVRDLGYTPLVLISASLPNARQRCSAGL